MSVGTDILRTIVCVAFFGLAASGVRAEEFTFYCVEPFSPGTERQLADEIVELKARTGFDLVLYSLSLHPEGRPAAKKAEHLIGSYRTLKAALAGSGVRLGVLVQATLGHWPRTDGDEEPWMLSVTIEGKDKRVCPLDPGCRAYIAATMEALAKEKPAFVLLDDDVHASGSFGVECFCARHTAAFNAANGTSYTPESFRAAIKACTAGDALSEKFLVFQRAFVNDLVGLVRASLDAVDPTIPAGACTPYRERRFAGETARRLAAKGQSPVQRIDNAVYMARTLSTFPNCVAHTQAMVDYWQEIPNLLDESDSCPHNLYSLSAAVLDLKLQSAAFNGLTGSKIWFVNGHKGDFPVSRRYTDVLAAHRGLYSAIARATQGTRLAGLVAPTLGGRRPWHWATQDEPFAPSDSWPTRMLASFGIPFVMRGSVGKDEICVLGGEQTVNALSDAELETLFRGTVLVDGYAALTLTERGLSHLMGVKAERTKPLYNSERDVASGVTYPFARKDVTPFLTPLVTGARTLTELCCSPYSGSPDVKSVAPGALALTNALGGRIVVTAYFANGFAWEMPQSDVRKAWTLRLLGELGWDDFAARADQDVTLLERKAADGSTLLALFNLGYDPLESVRLRVPSAVTSVRRLDAHGVWQPVAFTAKSGEIDVKTGRLASSEAVVLKVR